jgi:hypothetical protein
MRQQIFLEGRAVHCFPCGSNKKPTTPHGFKDAVADPKGIARLWAHYPGQLVGVPTGVISGIDVIDIDPRNGGDKWFFENRDKLPKTRTHETQRFGQHLVYRHMAGVRCSTNKIAKGVDLKGDGGFVIWWPQHGCRVLCEGPIADFPCWLWAQGEMGSTIEGAGQVSGAGFVEPIPSDGAKATAYEINYARRALANACFELRNCPQGSRNSKLNVLAWNMGRMIVRNWIGRQRVEDYLLACCEANGLLADDGLVQCQATLASGINAGALRPYHDIGSERSEDGS